MNESGFSDLLDQETLAARVDSDEAPDWVAAHWTSFRDGLLGDRNGSPFPCFFGVESVEKGWPLYSTVESLTDKDALLTFRDTLLEYLATYEDHAPNASFVVFFRPDGAETESDYHERLWHVLQFLHVHDPEPWPDDIPTDPDDPRWEFCFGGEPMFPTCRAPFYDDRKSRYCPVGLEVTFQPRSLFDGITHDTDAGQRARDVIQGRLSEYDGVCPHADLGDWGVEGDREWVQYMLSEDDSQFPDECPLAISRDHPKAVSTPLDPEPDAGPNASTAD
ncbi:YqcI/YcgG family protein [Salinigranum sp.]|uniref:YqcI/YcgG family protein n=1 Tax=Salinigranum sp. TaxID=1966351 RepID=UPI003562EC2F